ncbi:MAG: hypothetical protein F6K24_07460 [Okeania sp. SIO2D1]|nr:hypothetical protein [Okeania sp. SIO2D1]
MLPLDLYVKFAQAAEEILDADELTSFFTDAMDWGLAASKSFLAFLAAVALIIYMFKK